MRRVLTAARATVAPARRDAYLATLGELARHRASRSAHLWVFERDAESGTFLEFREGRADGPSPGAEEAELEARLATLVTYAPGHADQWLEVPLSTPSGG